MRRHVSLVALLVLGGCLQYAAFGYKIPLVYGYSLASDHSGSYAIVDSYDGLVTESSKYGILITVENGVIAGNMDTEETSRNVPAVPDRYFVLDANRGSVRENMKLEEYRSALREAGINDLPRLRRPTTMTRFGVLGRLRETILTGLWIAAFFSVPATIIYYLQRRIRRRPPAKGLWRLAWTIPFLLFVLSNTAMVVL